MKQNKFVIITTCYNVMPYIEMNHYMNRFQSYENFIVLYVDDGSTDGTYEFLKEQLVKETKFFVHRNPNGGGQGKAYMAGIDYLEKNNLISDEDIIVEVDGDDWLSSTFVLQYLDEVYQDSNVWMTFGQYQGWPAGNLGGHYNMTINAHCDDNNLYRQYPFPYSHLKTYKYWLFNKIDRKDLIDPETEEIFSKAWDHALCLPMVEMAGRLHCRRVEDILYVLNRHPDLQNEGSIFESEQKATELRIRSNPPYNKL